MSRLSKKKVREGSLTLNEARKRTLSPERRREIARLAILTRHYGREKAEQMLAAEKKGEK